MDNEETYLQAVEDFGTAIDLNEVLTNGIIADRVYSSLRPLLKDKLQSFLKNGG